ncbi:DUF262 domain-containing protein [Nocardioides jishulii]|uniref:DUF262 domain-containing protein n=1 Tax=Nocardioides jishulii TaxID=2575440 RepID=UPI001484F802|nr:DUF262 domain-containing protein [Nocardioides jishulii]
MVKHAGVHENWPIGDLVKATQTDPKSQIPGIAVKIPRFQRSLVWGDDQRKLLIESIHKGYPIGSLLLYKRPNPNGKVEVYQVVDGLQRTSTLVEYAENPLEYAPVAVFSDEFVQEVAAEYNTGAEHVRRALQDWMKTTGRLDSASGYESWPLKNYLDEFFQAKPDPNPGFIATLASTLDAVRQGR